MTTIPDLNQLRYATDPGRITEPPEGKKDTGFVTREEPSPTNWNWLQNKAFERFKSLQGSENHLIIGDATQKTNFVADLLITELNDAAADVGDKIAFLDGTHALTASLNLSDNDLELFCQSSKAVIDLDNSYILTLSGDRLRGNINIINAPPSGVIISGAGIEHLNIRINDADAIDFVGSGSIVVNGDLIDAGSTLRFLSNEPDMVVLTAAEQNMYSNDNRFVRYDPTTQTFLRRDDATVAVENGFWIVVKSIEELTEHLIFPGDRLKIRSHKGFQIPLGDQGDAIPYTILLRGDNCLMELFSDKSDRELAASLGDDKYTPMSNGLTAMENRRVIKSQGQGNRIDYNGYKIFSGKQPTACLDFVRPNDPYLLEWDEFIYEGLDRTPTFDNSLMCWFTDLYYWLDRRFNAQLPNPDLTLAYHTVTVPPRNSDFFRPIGIQDADRHSRTDYNAPIVDIIPSGEYTQVDDKIILTGVNAPVNIKNVKNGERIYDAGLGLPQGAVATTIIRPGSIVTDPGSESFLIMDAENNAPVTAAASGDLTLDFSGMAAGSFQGDAIRDITGRFEICREHTGSYVIPFTYGAFAIGADGVLAGGLDFAPPNQPLQGVDFAASNDPAVEVALENRSVNNLIIPYYKL